MMASTNDGDPFLQVQEDVLTQLTSVRPLFASYLRIQSLTTAGTSPELSSARADLDIALAALAEDLADLVASVRAVEGDPTHYGLDANELARRQRMVQDVGGEVDDMREVLEKAPRKLRKGNVDGGGPGDMLPDPSSFAIGEDMAGQNDCRNEDNYAEFEREQQLQILHSQDQHLDGVFQTVGNLRRQADDMGRELEEQHEMLEVADNLADRVGGQLQTGMEKLQHVIRRNEDRWSSCCIGVLVIVLIILLVLLLIL
ncbi:snare domain containing protein [Grosmannia clavigera kw1407]|uniref:t-SNARE affecting a late Golgi compartment protein 1 n=1 Tax=Grosmannia clavigera (strain kw1407 / UAMH 11150) TaxID=655863 RepID=F0XRU0_GROCL|nr:snare domain containing protein [Grosmannia clavigera kw1407]EFW99449.1 snare domain containing protein [Grosmannia clavigera kw1407]